MHIVKFMGGLGNQLFQFALYKKFQSLGFETCADLSIYDDRNKYRTFHLDKLGIELRIANKKEISKLYCSNPNGISGAIVRRLGKKTYYRCHDLYYDDTVLTANEGYFDGYWQSYRYFNDIRQEIIDSIVFPRVTDNYLYDRIMSDDSSVSVHIRNGDYLTNSYMYGGICTSDYYKTATDRMAKILGEIVGITPTFYIFSDDVIFSKKEFDIPKYETVYSDKCSSEREYDDLFLMSICRYHIIANSSFSWWGAYLGNNNITIAPTKWINGMQVEDIIPPNWFVI